MSTNIGKLLDLNNANIMIFFAYSCVTRYVCDHVRHHHPSDVRLRVSHLSRLVEVEESCEEVVEMAELLLSQGIEWSVSLKYVETAVRTAAMSEDY